MRVLEFFGPPGVGKTTLARALYRLLAARGIPAYVAREVPQLVDEHRKKRNGLSARWHRWCYRRSGLERWMRPRLEKEMMRRELQHLEEAPAPWPEYLAHCVQLGLGSSVEPAHRLARLATLSRVATAFHAATRLPGQDWVLFDEGLIQRGIALCEGMEPSARDGYFQRLPLPGAAVFVEADVDTIHARISTRTSADHWLHRLVEPALEASESAAAALQQRNVPVHRVRLSDDPVLEQARRLADALGGTAA